MLVLKDTGNFKKSFISGLSVALLIIQMECHIWLFEAYQSLDRELLVRLSHELTYDGPTVPIPTQTASQSTIQAPSVKTEPPVQQAKPQLPPRPVFQYKIKVWCNGVQVTSPSINYRKFDCVTQDNGLTVKENLFIVCQCLAIGGSVQSFLERREC